MELPRFEEVLGMPPKCLDSPRSPISSLSLSDLFPNCFIPPETQISGSKEKKCIVEELSLLLLLLFYGALHPLYRALHRSKRFDCSSKWGVTTEMVLIKKRWTSSEAKLLQPRVRQPQSSCKEGEVLSNINNLSKHMPNGNSG